MRVLVALAILCFITVQATPLVLARQRQAEIEATQATVDVVTQAVILTEQNEPGQAINFLQRHLAINPGNNSLTMSYVDALIQSRSYSTAAEVMERHSLGRPDDVHLWYKLAETQGQAGNISKVHQARAEYFRLIADYPKARQQLQLAIRIESDNGSSPAEEARLKQKIQQIDNLQQNASR